MLLIRSFIKFIFLTIRRFKHFILHIKMIMLIEVIAHNINKKIIKNKAIISTIYIL